MKRWSGLRLPFEIQDASNALWSVLLADAPTTQGNHRNGRVVEQRPGGIGVDLAPQDDPTGLAQVLDNHPVAGAALEFGDIRLDFTDQDVARGGKGTKPLPALSVCGFHCPPVFWLLRGVFGGQGLNLYERA